MRLKRSPIVAIIVLLIVVIGTGAIYLYLVNQTNVFKSNPASSTSYNGALPGAVTKVLPKVASILDGTLVSADVANRHPIGVMIENHPDARPQSGLSSASIVYEAIAEGGITRFLAIFGPQDSTVGPIRSARTYFVDWAEEYDAYLAHVGGNYDAEYEKIPADKVKDIDEFANAGSYHRVLKQGLALEHTMYSDTATLFKLALSKKWPTPLRDDYNIYTFMDDMHNAAPTASTVSINFSAPEYKVDYAYEAVSNSYKRDLAGKPHIDIANNQQIAAKNVIVQYIDRTAVVTKINEPGFSMPTVGSGKATIYQGGTKIVGTWKKTASTKRTEFYDASGTLIKLYPGQTWIEIVNPGSTVADK